MNIIDKKRLSIGGRKATMSTYYDDSIGDLYGFDEGFALTVITKHGSFGKYSDDYDFDSVLGDLFDLVSDEITEEEVFAIVNELGDNYGFDESDALDKEIAYFLGIEPEEISTEDYKNWISEQASVDLDGCPSFYKIFNNTRAVRFCQPADIRDYGGGELQLNVGSANDYDGVAFILKEDTEDVADDKFDEFAKSMIDYAAHYVRGNVYGMKVDFDDDEDNDSFNGSGYIGDYDFEMMANDNFTDWSYLDDNDEEEDF